MGSSESRTRGRAVTRADVARYAGVSTAVVSYVVNNGPKPVAAHTAARVREAIELLNYRPNVNAQALRRGTTEMLGLILSDATNPFFVELASAVGSAAHARGYAMMMGASNGDGATEDRLIDDLLRRQVDGLVVASIYQRPTLHHPLTTGIPMVWLDNFHDVPGFPSIGPDSHQGAQLAVQHLFDHGHRNIGLIVGISQGAPVDPREYGWLDTLRRAGISDGSVAHVEWSREGGYAGGLQLLGQPKPPTAVFASSDLQAIGLLRAARELGLRVPEDLAIVAFDGTKESEFSWPPLTVVAQPIQKLAGAAVELLLDGPGLQPQRRFPLDLIIRRSCGCPEPLEPTGRSEQTDEESADDTVTTGVH